MKHTPITSFPENYLSTAIEHLNSNSVFTAGGCIVWTLSVDKDGYGRFHIPKRVFGHRRRTGSHRAAWLAHVGEIPQGLQIDHLCFNPSCVNVGHMELVTAQENIKRRRRVGRNKVASSMAHSCGVHGRTDGYEKTRKDGYTYWACRHCRREISRRYKARLKEAA